MTPPALSKVRGGGGGGDLMPGERKKRAQWPIILVNSQGAWDRPNAEREDFELVEHSVPLKSEVRRCVGRHGDVMVGRG